MHQDKDVTWYATGSKVLHWLIALLVLLMLCFSFFLSNLSEANQPQGYMIHKSIGLTVLGLMVLRMLWIHYRGRPNLPPTVPRWEKIASRAVQYSFYVLLLAMPFSGWLLSVAENHMPQYFGLFTVPTFGILPNQVLAEAMDIAHKTIAWILIVLVFLHVAGALKHHLIDKDNVLRRMWFDSKRPL